MKIMDCRLFYGASVNGEPYRGCDTFAALQEEADRCGITGGLVQCLYSDTVGVDYGNRMAAADVQSDKTHDFYGVWAVLPPFTGETPAPEALPGEMRKNKIGAIYLNPAVHRYVLNDLTMGELLSTAQEQKIPVLLNTCNQLPMEQIYKIMREFPRLTAIVGDGDCWPNARKLYPLADTYEHLYLDLSFVMDAGGVEDQVRRFGAEKLLFGTSFPARYTGSMLAVVRTAQISEQARALIFAGNLERILEEAGLK